MRIDNFTAHAVTRLKERTSLSPFELNHLFSKEAFINLGCKPGINKDHLLFYSRPDEQFFVAVLDNLIGDIITIWPEEYHQNLHTVLTSKQKLEAQQLAIEASKREQQSASMYSVTAGYLDANDHPKAQLLYKASIAHFDWSFENKKMELFEQLKSKRPDAKILNWISVREGKNGDITAIKL